ncbi:MAG: hypothetical protein KJ077_07745 [Anaerolineae bacterium]|nr:hypothetical protein [Anaerolineae bacterium]
MRRHHDPQLIAVYYQLLSELRSFTGEEKEYEDAVKEIIKDRLMISDYTLTQIAQLESDHAELVLNAHNEGKVIPSFVLNYYEIETTSPSNSSVPLYAELDQMEVNVSTVPYGTLVVTPGNCLCLRVPGFRQGDQDSFLRVIVSSNENSISAGDIIIHKARCKTLTNLPTQIKGS